jgi:hypothetical protein
VISNDPDTDAPELHHVAADTDSLHLTGGETGEVTITVQASDIGTGIEVIDVDLENEEQSWGAGCSIWPQDGARHEVEDSCTVHFWDHMPTGTWRGSVRIRDVAGNVTYVDADELEARGYGFSVVVTRDE